jgi:phage tail sheath protein FI
MPEYLSPGVYVEEIDTGSKPIEGVSTSTAAMIGVAERGPVDVPILVTSTGEFTRWFGEKLDPVLFSNGSDRHCFLPHAVEGFFTNGGKRLFVTRVLDTAGARRADFTLHDRGAAASSHSMLLRAAGEGTGTVPNPPALSLLSTGVDTTLVVPANGDRIRVGDGSRAEYFDVNVVAAANTSTDVPLNLALARSHANGTPVADVTPPAATAVAGAFTLTQTAPSGSETVTILIGAGDDALLTAPAPAILVLAVGAGVHTEHRYVTGVTIVDATHALIVLDSALAQDFPVGTPTALFDINGAASAADTLAGATSAGDSVIYLTTKAAGTFANAAHFITIDGGNPAAREIRNSGILTLVPLSSGAYGEYSAGAVVDAVTLAEENYNLTVAANIGDTNITVDNVTNIAAGDRIQIGTGANLEEVAVTSIAGLVVNIAPPLTLGHLLTPAEQVVSPAFMRRHLTATARAGSTVLAVDNRVGLAAGDVIRIGNGTAQEYATIAAIPNRAAVAPDAGNLILTAPINTAHAAAAAPAHDVHRMGSTPVAVVAARPVSSVVLDMAPGSTLMTLSNGAGFAANDFIRVQTLAGGVFYHQLLNALPLDVHPTTLTAPLTMPHEAGSPAVGRDPLILVEALDAGAWGNRLRISVEDESPGLVSRAGLRQVLFADQIRLTSTAGVESGTVLELLDPLNDDAVLDPPIKVVTIDRASNNLIRLAANLNAAQLNAHANAQLAGTALGVRSREFKLTVRLLHQPDPARPQRNDIEIDREEFLHLSMDPRHSRYFQRIIGQIGGPPRLSDRRPEGESWYIRTLDQAANQAELESVRPGPEALVDIAPSGRTRPAGHALSHGDDSIATISDATYVGLDNADPDLRTGMFSLVNVDDISILAAPGRTGPLVQGALIDQCELLRYRFAVLDSPAPPTDTLADVQNQRQQFDTKYAALYYPWLVTPEPFPANLQKIQDYPIPPSGHMLGVYARTDIERGVHKAPANEVVRGITGLQRSLNKGEQDLLNQFPVNIDVIRDFRINNRGIRVWGARVITSDSDWKYVNVRRLMIFIEKSLDQGLQWVVFEPNAEPLWARVRRSISNFLTVVWRNGALEGTKKEEAFFVKCDRTTMTQTDIDSGRLICVIGVAPVKPAEFVIIRIGLWTAHAED